VHVVRRADDEVVRVKIVLRRRVRLDDVAALALDVEIDDLALDGKAAGRDWISKTWVLSWKVRPYWLVLIASSRRESVVSAPVASASLRKLPMLTSGFWLGTGGVSVRSLSLWVASRYMADQMKPAASHAALVVCVGSSHTRVSAVVML